MKTLSRILVVTLALAAVSAVAAPAMAQEHADHHDGGATLFASTTSGAALGGAIGAGLVLMGGGAAIARIGGSAVESMARQPEAAGQINGAMIIAAAMVEGATLFGVVVCLMAVLKT